MTREQGTQGKTYKAKGGCSFDTQLTNTLIAFPVSCPKIHRHDGLRCLAHTGENTEEQRHSGTHHTIYRQSRRAGIMHDLVVDDVGHHRRCDLGDTGTDADHADFLWVRPISPDSFLQAELTGWYHVHNFYVQNQYGARFLFDSYGTKWLAFEMEF